MAGPAFIVHGGAGSGRYPKTDPRFRELSASVEVGLAAMRKGSSLDGVVAAVEHMEETGIFNAGRGACMTAMGKLQLDAAVMRGDTLRGAGVAVVESTYHPVTLARWVAENTGAVLLAGRDTRAYARAAGLRDLKLIPAAASRAKFRRLVSELKPGEGNPGLWDRIRGGGTVGAVAVDRAGVPAAAGSPGGMWLKLPGRVGDSAVLGAGVFADGHGAACATGTGEAIIRSATTFTACRLISPQVEFPRPPGPSTR